MKVVFRFCNPGEFQIRVRRTWTVLDMMDGFGSGKENYNEQMSSHGRKRIVGFLRAACQADSQWRGWAAAVVEGGGGVAPSPASRRQAYVAIAERFDITLSSWSESQAAQSRRRPHRISPVVSREWRWGQQEQHQMQQQRGLCSKESSSQDDGADSDAANSKENGHGGEQKSEKDEGAGAAESESNGASVKEMLLKEALGYVV